VVLPAQVVAILQGPSGNASEARAYQLWVGEIGLKVGGLRAAIVLACSSRR